MNAEHLGDEPPSYIKSARHRTLVFVAVIALSLSIVIGAGLWLAAAQDNRRQDLCAAAVQGREDNRTMWLYLLHSTAGEQHTPAEEKQIQDFTNALNNKLPELTCQDGSAVPVPDEESSGD